MKCQFFALQVTLFRQATHQCHKGEETLAFCWYFWCVRYWYLRLTTEKHHHHEKLRLILGQIPH